MLQDFKSLVKHLDPEQRSSVLTDSKFVNVVGLQGTGKSTALVWRIKYLHEIKRILFKDIGIITKDQSSVGILTWKIRGICGLNARKDQIFTFDKFLHYLQKQLVPGKVFHPSDIRLDIVDSQIKKGSKILKRYKVLLIDDSHGFTKEEWDFLTRFMEKATSVFIAGESRIELNNQSKEREEFLFRNNHRSLPTIVEALNRFSSDESLSMHALREKVEGFGSGIYLLDTRNNDSKSDALVKYIHSLVLDNKNFGFRDFTILFHSHSDASPLFIRLLDSDLPFRYEYFKNLLFNEKLRFVMSTFTWWLKIVWVDDRSLVNEIIKKYPRGDVLLRILDMTIETNLHINFYKFLEIIKSEFKEIEVWNNFFETFLRDFFMTLFSTSRKDKLLRRIDDLVNGGDLDNDDKVRLFSIDEYKGNESKFVILIGTEKGEFGGTSVFSSAISRAKDCVIVENSFRDTSVIEMINDLVIKLN